MILPIVIRLPAVPVTVKVVTVVEVPAVKFTVCGGVSTLKSLKVFEPTKLNGHVPAPVHHILLKVSPPPLNVFVCELASVTFIVEVHSMSVRPVMVAMFHTVPVPVSENVPEPIVIVLVLADAELSIVNEWFKLLKSTDPLVCVNCAFEVIAS